MSKSAKKAVSAERAQSSEMLSITQIDAEQLYELYNSVEAADSHFHTCQSVQFRDYVKATYKAHNVRTAFERLKQGIDHMKGV